MFEIMRVSDILVKYISVDADTFCKTKLPFTKNDSSYTCLSCPLGNLVVGQTQLDNVEKTLQIFTDFYYSFLKMVLTFPLKKLIYFLINILKI